MKTPEFAALLGLEKALLCGKAWEVVWKLRVPVGAVRSCGRKGWAECVGDHGARDERWTITAAGLKALAAEREKAG